MSSASKAYYDMAKELKIKNKNLQDENEALSSANQDLLHEVRVLKNKAENLEHDFMYYFKLANKLDHQIKRYREAIKKAMKLNIDENYNFDLDKLLHEALESESDGS